MTGPVAIHRIGCIDNNLQSCAPSATWKTTPVTETITALVYCGYNDHGLIWRGRCLPLQTD